MQLKWVDQMYHPDTPESFLPCVSKVQLTAYDEQPFAGMM